MVQNENSIYDINVFEISDESFDAASVINLYREIINSSNCLQNGLFGSSNLLGDFDEDTWVLLEDRNKTYIYIYFDKLKELKFLGLSDVEILLIKSWLVSILFGDVSTISANDLMQSDINDDYNISRPSTCRSYYNSLINFIIKSKNFSDTFLDASTGSELDEYFSNIDSAYSKKTKVDAIRNYVDFIEDYFFYKNHNTANKYINKLNIISNNIKLKSKSRQLPNSSDILLFHNYLKLFFNSNYSHQVKMLYYPILLWWKITTVIPMRPSEFCLKLTRDCLVQIGDDFYLKIGRIKQKKDLKRCLLPVLDRIKITKEIYDLIYNYIKETNQYGPSKTLISWRAFDYYRRNVEHNTINTVVYTGSTKINHDYFTINNLDALLETFYQKIILDTYNDKDIKEYLNPGDTRHIAFTALMLQGFSPVEIAIIGGHRTLAALDNYTCSNNTYIDSEVIILINKNLSERNLNRTSFKKIIFSKSPQCNKKMNQDMEVEIDGIILGYCTGDFLNKLIPCESQDCFECSKWWCEPTESNYNTLVKIMLKRITTGTDKLKRDINFMKTLFKETKITSVNKDLTIDTLDKNRLKRTSMCINSDCNELIKLKAKLINNNIEYSIINELNSINNSAIHFNSNTIDNMISKKLIK